ncbi:PAS domain-containing protein, partial [Clostridium perfringens]
MYLSRNIKMSLLGHEPDEFAKMYIQREELLSTLEEGIIAINHEGIVTLFNSAAINMLDIEEKNPEGKYIIDVFPKTELINVIKDKESQYNKDMIINDKVIISNRILIRENDKVMGAVAIFRNKTEVTRLAEQLTGVNQIIDALRANTHEFMNKLHIILGLIQ